MTRTWRGYAVFAMGLITVLVAHFVLKDCGDAGMMLKTAAGGTAPMRCYWSEHAIDLLGGVVALIGLVMILKAEAEQALSLVAAATGLIMIASVLWIVPTCVTATMTCNVSLKPGALVLGALTTIIGVVAAVKSSRAVGQGVNA